MPFLTKYNLSQYFSSDLIITGDTVQVAGLQGKPAPDPYKLAIQRLCTSSLLVFEDTIPGVASAKQAGATVVALGFDPVSAVLLTSGTLEYPPDLVVANYDEALQLAELQKTLCTVGLERVRHAGLLFYTVCTLTRPETIGIVEYCTKETGRQPVSKQALWPGSSPAPQAEGFFAAFL